MILYGSRALKSLFPDFTREPSDSDWLLSKEEYQNKELQEGVDKDGFKRHEFARIPVFDKYIDYKTPLTKDELYTLKVSHIFWNIKWDKHIYDIIFLQKQNCQLQSDLLTDLHNYWSTYHRTNVRLSFKQSNEDFFKDAVTRVYKHDDLHEIVKVHEMPMFNYIKEDKNNAEISEKLFNSLSFEDKLLVVQEEACVLAFERYIIHNKRMNSRSAYTKALKDLILRLTPLWLGVFIIENYLSLYKPHLNYKEKINKFYELY